MRAPVTDTKPWYRYVWPWVLIGISVLTLVVSFTLVWVAVVNKDSEVRDDWYKDGQAINQELARDDYATALTISARLEMNSTQLVVHLQSPYTLPAAATPAELSLHFSHPTDAARDQSLMLRKQADGSYTGVLSHSLEGRYYLELGCPLWRLRLMDGLPKPSLTLLPEPPKKS